VTRARSGGAPREQRITVVDAELRIGAFLEGGKAVAAKREIIVDGDAMGFLRLDGRAVEFQRSRIDLRSERPGAVPAMLSPLETCRMRGRLSSFHCCLRRL